MEYSDLRFGYEIELVPKKSEFEFTSFSDDYGIYNHMREHGLDIYMHWDNDDVLEMKTVGPLTFDKMIEHYETLMTHIRRKFTISEYGGIHIHISMKDDNINFYIKNIILQYVKFEDLIYFICSNTKHEGKIIHRYNDYCNSIFGAGDCLEEIACGIEDAHEYGLCGNTDYDTIEFRMVDSGFNVDRFKSIATMFANLIICSYNESYEKYIDDEDEIMDKNSYELEYYYTRSQVKMRESINYKPERIKEFLKFLKIEDENITKKIFSLYKRNFTITSPERELVLA